MQSLVLAIISRQQVSHNARLQAERRCLSEPDGGATVLEGGRGEHGCKPLRGRASSLVILSRMSHLSSRALRPFVSVHRNTFEFSPVFLLYSPPRLGFPRLHAALDSVRLVFKAQKEVGCCRWRACTKVWRKLHRGVFFSFLCQRSFQSDATYKNGIVL